jgi:hypothetical protein
MAAGIKHSDFLGPGRAQIMPGKFAAIFGNETDTKICTIASREEIRLQMF